MARKGLCERCNWPCPDSDTLCVTCRQEDDEIKFEKDEAIKVQAQAKKNEAIKAQAIKNKAIRDKAIRDKAIRDEAKWLEIRREVVATRGLTLSARHDPPEEKLSSKKTNPEKQQETGCSIVGALSVPFCVLLHHVFVMSADTPRPLLQVGWFIFFVAVSLPLLHSTSCGGPSWLVATYFVAQVTSILLYVFDGYWWFSRSEQVGSPILFANALFSLCWTYPFIHMAFVLARKCVEKKKFAFGIMVGCFVAIPFMVYCYWVAERMADPANAIASIKMSRYSGLTAIEHSKAAANSKLSATSTGQSYTTPTTNSSNDDESFVETLRGRDWHGYSNQQKQIVCSIISSRMQSRYPVATQAWLLSQLNDFFRDGFAPSEKVLETALLLIVAAENE